MTVSIHVRKKFGSKGREVGLNIIHDHGLLSFFSFQREEGHCLYLGSMKIRDLAPIGLSFSLKKKSGGFWLVLMQTWCNRYFIHRRSKLKHFVHKLK